MNTRGLNFLSLEELLERIKEHLQREAKKDMVGKVVNAKVKVRYKGKAISIKNRKIEERCRA